jgi:hypothetical protein
MKEPMDTIADDLKRHPELNPIMDVDSHGNVVCLGWTSPIYTFDRKLPEDIEKGSKETDD